MSSAAGQTSQAAQSSATTAEASTSTKKEEEPAKPTIPRTGLHESLIHGTFYQKYPKLSAFSDIVVPISSMYWSKAPVWGAMPTHCFKSHTCTTVGSTIWIIGGRYSSDGKNEGTGWDEPIPPNDTPFWNVYVVPSINPFTSKSFPAGALTRYLYVGPIRKSKATVLLRYALIHHHSILGTR
jgi:hypothetical protein